MKLCCICKKEKRISAFNKKSASKDGHQPHCRECSHAKFKAYYHSNREKHYREVKENAKRYALRNKQYIEQYKLEHSCPFCPESDPCCMDFHHLRDKEFDVAAHAGCSLRTLKEEIAKCILLCSNCHRKLHAGKLKVEELKC